MASKRIAEPNRIARAYWEEIRAGITPEAATFRETRRRIRRRPAATRTSLAGSRAAPTSR
jgi:hypothetical protein